MTSKRDLVRDLKAYRRELEAKRSEIDSELAALDQSIAALNGSGSIQRSAPLAPRRSFAEHADRVEQFLRAHHPKTYRLRELCEEVGVPVGSISQTLDLLVEEGRIKETREGRGRIVVALRPRTVRPGEPVEG